jgi:predicted nucleic acid-binding protein
VIVVCDSTVLIGLSRIGKLELLQHVFGQIFIPRAVFREVTGKGLNRPGAESIKEANWIKVTEIKDRSQVSFLLGTLDKGEAEVLTLAKESSADLILLDEEKARNIALIAGFDVMGLLGLFLLAKNTGILKRIGPLIEELKRKNFRISDRVVYETLKTAGE